MAASWKHASTGNPKYVIATVNDAIFSGLSARSMRKFASIAMNRRDTSNATMKYRTVVGLIAIVRRFIAKNDIQPRVFSPSPYSPRCFHAGALTRFSSFMDLFFRKLRSKSRSFDSFQFDRFHEFRDHLIARNHLSNNLKIDVVCFLELNHLLNVYRG